MIPEFGSTHQSNQQGELNDSSISRSISDDTRADSRSTDYLSLLNQLPSSLWAKSPADTGKIHRCLPPRFKQISQNLFPESTPYT